jgi:hypothetical protein
MHMFIALIVVLALAGLALWGLIPLVRYAAEESPYASPVAPAADPPQQQRIAEEAGSSSMSGSQN